MAKHTALWRQLDAYFAALESSSLTDNSVRDYYYFAEVFVRWIDGTFVPGAGQEPPNGRSHVNGKASQRI